VEEGQFQENEEKAAEASASVRDTAKVDALQRKQDSLTRRKHRLQRRKRRIHRKRNNNEKDDAAKRATITTPKRYIGMRFYKDADTLEEIITSNGILAGYVDRRWKDSGCLQNWEETSGIPGAHTE
jgi:hypothetical protein